MTDGHKRAGSGTLPICLERSAMFTHRRVLREGLAAPSSRGPPPGPAQHTHRCGRDARCLCRDARALLGVLKPLGAAGGAGQGLVGGRDYLDLGAGRAGGSQRGRGTTQGLQSVAYISQARGRRRVSAFPLNLATKRVLNPYRRRQGGSDSIPQADRSSTRESSARDRMFVFPQFTLKF